MATAGLFKNAIKKDVGFGTVSTQNPNGTFTTIYTAPPGKTSYIIECDIACTGASGVQASVLITKSSAAVAAGSDASALIVKGAPVPVGSAIQVIDGQKIVLEPGDSLAVKTEVSGTTVDVIVSLVEDVNL